MSKFPLADKIREGRRHERNTRILIEVVIDGGLKTRKEKKLAKEMLKRYGDLCKLLGAQVAIAATVTRDLKKERRATHER